MVTETNVDAPDCTQVNDNGLRCIRKLYKATNGEFWDHPGGHMFASPEAKNIILNEHVDATAFWAGTPMKHHSPEECDGEGYCAWRRHE